MSIMDITAPLIPLLVIYLIQLVSLPLLTYAFFWFFVPDLNRILGCSLFHSDMIIEADTAKMHIERGIKDDTGDMLYANKSTLMHKRKPVRIDSTKWDPDNVTRWGSINVRFYYPGKGWPKTVPRMAATQVCKRIASQYVKKVEKVEDEKAEIEAEEPIIKYNELLCLIAKSNSAKALTLLKCKESEIEQYARQFIVIPDSDNKDRNIVDKLLKKQDPGTIEKLLPQLVEEIFMVRTACTMTTVEPQLVALPEMMHSYPDLETSSEMLTKIEDRYDRKARANAPNMKIVIMGFIGMAILFVIAIIVVVALMGGKA